MMYLSWLKLAIIVLGFVLLVVVIASLLASGEKRDQS